MSGLFFIESSSVRVRITRQGLPAAKLCGGIERVTTLPVLITQPFPMMISGRIVTFSQIQQLPPPLGRILGQGIVDLIQSMWLLSFDPPFLRGGKHLADSVL